MKQIKESEKKTNIKISFLFEFYCSMFSVSSPEMTISASHLLPTEAELNEAMQQNHMRTD